MACFSEPLSFVGTKKIKEPSEILNSTATTDASGNTFTNGGENKFASDSHRRTRFTDQSNIRVLGGKAAGPKPIKANYDADDARIVDLKQQGWSDEYVARKLAEEGRIRYVGRTVGSRWLRIRKALEAKEEEILEDELSDWHDGEDESLEQAVKAIDAKIDKEIAKLRDKKWQQVAFHVADLIQKKKYTAKLCRERYDSLMDGTALKPIELDSDQDGRAEMRGNRIATNRRLREEAAAVAQLEEQQKMAERLAKKEAREANAVIKVTKAQQKKIDAEKIANMKKAAVEQRKTQRLILAQWAAYNKAESAWLLRKKKAEVVLCNKLLGLPAGFRRTKVADEDDEGEMTDRETDEGALDDVSDDGEHMPSTRSTRKHTRDSGSGSDNPTPNKKVAGSTLIKHVGIGEAEVTDETRSNPRSVLTLVELNNVLIRRDLPRCTGQESHEQVVARLHTEDQNATNSVLNDLLKASGLETRGNKQEKIERLQSYDVSRSAAGEQ